MVTQQEKKNAFYLSVSGFSTKVLIGDIILAPPGDYPLIPRGGQLSRKKRRWPIIDPILVTLGECNFLDPTIVKATLQGTIRNDDF